ncbi:DUF3099 domain-containing protein [Nocardioides sp.]|uniref:DUF3099 domain-containing protein n=1 Tax=Nocardioides sp. TaxID=35761 RepID=UPI000C95121B|nr:DUF3099 domain-containing protein [Nocardioides sp.]MAS54561.1 hypothetical protein [Pimelobacter sp.]MDE0775999.1 DUF3099 domain-containing protein [Nocardioides sp.]|tara:strand:+ start:64 stop:393 length:330 start_codon:yes stop_codon:yes gene_type:complete
MAREHQRSGEAIRITTAAANRADDIRARQKRYLLSMSLRTLCFVGAVLASLAGIDWLWPFLIAGALVLPYIAVVMANAAANLTDGFKLREADFSRRELESGRSSHASEL